MRRGRDRRFDERAVNRLAPGAEGAAHRAAQVGLAPMRAGCVACGGSGGASRPAGGRPSAAAPRRTRRACRRRSRAGAAPRRRCSAPATVGLLVVSPGSGASSSPSASNAMLSSRTTGGGTSSRSCSCSHHAAKGAVVGVGVLRASQQAWCGRPSTRSHGVPARRPRAPAPKAIVLPTGTSSPAAAQQPREPDRDPVELDGFRHCAPSRSAPARSRPCAPRALLVFAVLQDRAEGDVDGALVDRGGAERGERVRPVDRLGDAGRLVELELAQRLDRGGNLTREHLGHVGRPDPEDRELTLEVGVRDPVVQAPALQRVVDVARAVRRDDDDRRLLGAERAELGNGDRVVGEDLEQERLELVVGAVDLVDEQDRRRGDAERLGLVRDRPEQRPLHEEALGVELVLDDLLPLRLRRRGGAAAGASSPTRRRPARRRCPRSTAAARARRRSSATAPWRPRSCRRPPRPRAATAAAGVSRGRSRWRGPRRPGTGGRRARRGRRRRSPCAPNRTGGRTSSPSYSESV